MMGRTGAGGRLPAGESPAPTKDQPEVNIRVVLAGVVLMLGLALCVLMAAVTAKHYGHPGVRAEPVALASNPRAAAGSPEASRRAPGRD